MIHTLKGVLSGRFEKCDFFFTFYSEKGSKNEKFITFISTVLQF